MSEGYRPVDAKGAVVAFNEGATAMENGDRLKAIQSWHQALELDATLIPAALNLLTHFQEEGNLAAEAGVWDILLDYDPFDTDHLVLQAAAYRKMQQYSRALENYHRAISIYPYFKFWYQELATIYGELGREEEVNLWHGRGQSLAADEAEVCFEDGVRHAKKERWESARSCFDAVLDEFPANLDARLRLAQVLEECGNTDDVIRQYEIALELTESARGLVYQRLGDFYARLGRLEHARSALQKAADSAPRFRKVDRTLLSVETKLGLFEETKTAESSEDDDVMILVPDEIEMELVQAPTRPSFQLSPIERPNAQQPWPSQVTQLLERALAVASPGGSKPRVALIMEPDYELSQASTYVLRQLQTAERKLRFDGSESQIFFVLNQMAAQVAGGVSIGWMGQTAFSPTPDKWTRSRPGLALGAAIDAVRTNAGDSGFNCLFILGFGRCVPDARDAAELLRITPVHCVCYIHPTYHYADLRILIGHATSNFMEITV